MAGTLIVSNIEAQNYKFDSDTTGMTIGSTGRVTTPNKIAFLAVGNKAAYATTSPIAPATIVYNDGSGYDASTGRFTVPVGGDGLYSFHLHMGIVNITTGGGNCYPQMVAMRGGTTLFSIYTYWSHPDTASYGSTHISRIHKLEAGDYVYLGFSQTNANYYDNPSELNFQGFLIG